MEVDYAQFVIDGAGLTETCRWSEVRHITVVAIEGRGGEEDQKQSDIVSNEPE